MRVSAFLLLLLLTCTASAAIDAYPFPNEELAVRYDALIAELRCPQCLNTNLAGSDAMIAQDLRREVHRMLLEGKSDDEILTFMYERYGDFILYRPRMAGATLVLWLGPLALLALAAFIWFRFAQRSAAATAAPLSDQEKAKIDQLLSRGE